jgi:hypothetical protein
MPGRASALFLLATAMLLAQPSPEFWPGAVYDRAIPSFRQVLGYDPGDRITSHAGIQRYLEALAAASPRIRIFQYGESWEGRKLVYAVIGSEQRMSNLESVRNAIQAFGDPRRTSETASASMVPNLPAVVWLGSGVHGDEISPSDAVLLTAYHLLAARNDPMVDSIFANDLVLIDPLQNPDGRERFLNYYEQAQGLEPDPDPVAAEHTQPWPGGRYNHYLFDLNRDWLALTQPEVQAEVKVLRDWLPLVSVDLHEMSGEATYFFSPEADPYNPNLTTTQRGNLALFGRNNARWFDRYGFDYFTREQYDAFYPGYGASWPEYYGSIAMTYEQGSPRGMVMRRADGNLVAFRDAVRHHFVACLSTLETAAQNRAKLLGDFYRYRASAIEEGTKGPVRSYILPPGRDPSATDKLAAILVAQAIEVKRATGPFRAAGREYPSGTYVVSLEQPAKRLIRTLLDAHTPLDEHFVAAEETRRKQKESSEIYDVTAWSLPLMFHVDAVAAAEPVMAEFEPVTADPRPGALHGENAKVAYLVSWGTEAAGRLLAASLRQNLTVHTADREFRQDGRTYPAGSLIFKVNANGPRLGETLSTLARSTGATVYGTDSGWVEDGVNFGSRFVVAVRKPAIAILWDMPVQSAAAGAARFVLERQYGYPVTPIRALQLASADLSRFNVLIVPPGVDYGDWIGEKGAEKLKNWVSTGGTLIALGESVDFLASSDVKLLDLARESAANEAAKKKDEPDDDSGRVPGTEISSDEQFEQAIRRGGTLPDGMPGALLRARIRPGHWLTAGAGDSVDVMVTGAAIYTPIKDDKGVNVAYFESADKLLASGYLWSENRRQIAYKPLVVTENSGRGVVVGFTADPNFRGMLDGMNLLFLNAVFRGPSHVRTAPAE